MVSKEDKIELYKNLNLVYFFLNEPADLKNNIHDLELLGVITKDEAMLRIANSNRTSPHQLKQLN